MGHMLVYELDKTLKSGLIFIYINAISIIIGFVIILSCDNILQLCE
jgi:hypothetical protein